jgi:methyltransferase-like protein/ubiquinone/menaquinone biosynthesis C-methylase UbiE
MKVLDTEVPNTYDLVPYDSFSFPQSHPDRLATIATLFGLKPAAIKTCRVLELGCASGMNLIPVAASVPSAQFIGVDLSKRQVEAGQTIIKELKLKNIELRHLNLMDINAEFGTFDYIIAHGLFSWVKDDVQEKILGICHDNLAYRGVAYVSYNTFPGWHFRGMIRDMMLYHAGKLEDVGMRAAQSRALIDFLAQAVPTQDNAYGIMLKNELDLLRSQRDSYLLHDHLEEANEPVYFHQFAERTARHGLQYLGEADFSTMLTSNFPKEIDETLRRISNDIVRTEQYMDFVRNRSFRQSLLCRQELQVNRNLDYRSILPLQVASPARPLSAPVDIASSKPETFALANGFSITSPQPITKAALQYLSETWPQSVSFEELLNVSRSRIAPTLIQDRESTEVQKQALASDLLTAYVKNAIVLRTEAVEQVTVVSEKPKASALARYQAKSGQFITNQLHESITVDVFTRHLIEQLDGRKNIDDIVNGMVKLAEDGTLVVQKDAKQLSDTKDLREVLSVVVPESLQKMAKAALLVA